MIPIRDENPTRRFPAVTVGLIAANILVFVYQVSLGPVRGEELVFHRGLIPALVWEFPGLEPLSAVSVASTFVSSMFLHGGLLHLLGNMLFMWVFGDNVEDRMGRGRFLAFYLLCGLAAAATQIAALPDSRIPMVGASGAISGVMGAYMILYPGARVLTVIPIFIFLHFVRLPAIFVLGIWFLFQVLSSAMSGSETGGVAWFAHIGGFVAGLVLVVMLVPRRRPPPPRREVEWV
jgi:membrane associated rhomboid family serine protease